MTESRLEPERYPTSDFFVADIPKVVPKSDMPSMPHPFFALKKGDHEPRFYENKGTKVTVTPSYYGMATIFDKDLWLYAISQIVAGEDSGHPNVGPHIRFSAHEFMRATNRPAGGKSYSLLRQAIRRMDGTRVETNIQTGGESGNPIEKTDWFGLIKDGNTLSGKVDGRGTERLIEFTIPPWLYKSIQSRDVLTISRDYFRLKKALDRRIYEIARKMCGNQKEMTIGLENLAARVGGKYPMRRLRFELKQIQERQEMPEYHLILDATKNVVRFKNRDPGARRAPAYARARGKLSGYSEDHLRKMALPGEATLEDVARRLARAAQSQPAANNAAAASGTLDLETCSKKPTAKDALQQMQESLGVRKRKELQV
ncbi:Replication initiator protein A (plasmid) [Thioalkalivibrio sp. K90mix]|uniref:replication initiator protein A n=1 Tax=Thioalkalivibrio sp. (strain K90mix) TaxID=396595 RepID=UPI000195A691|nr:replication initiator protein A [Thioalkalivibrio sp. K90mix]ADC73267.1 Replication initiator protein A [Thioalkalivibrio sp. K90mix]